MKLGSAVMATVGIIGLVSGVAWTVSADAMAIAGYPAPLVLAAVAVAVQWVAFIPAFALKTERFYDLVGSLTFLSLVGLAAWSAHGQSGLTTRGMISAALVAVWAVRLGTYLYRRVRAVGHDARFDEIKRSGHHFLFVWTLQGGWVFLTSLAVLVVLTAEGQGTSLGLWAFLGWALWLIGFTIEVVADRQKAAFRARQTGPRRWIDEGLWSCAQHPNYFGEMLLWTGLFVAGIGVYEGAQWVAVISPLFVILLLSKGSGIPLLQAQARARWGDDPEYQAYLARTHLLIPLPSRRSSS